MLRAENIEKNISGKKILYPLSLHIKEGEFVTVLGANGAGKSTLFKVLSMATQASKGKLYIGGQEAKVDNPRMREKIGVISHHSFLYDNLTALENLTYYGKAYSVVNLEKRIKEVLRFVGLNLYMYEPVRTYSRGMQQRLAIARAILHNPDILFLDEPYTGLDQEAIEILNNTIRQLHQEGKTIFMITHNYEDALRISNRLIVIAKGQKVYDEYSDGIKREDFRELYLKLVGG